MFKAFFKCYLIQVSRATTGFPGKRWRNWVKLLVDKNICSGLWSNQLWLLKHLRFRCCL